MKKRQCQWKTAGKKLIPEDIRNSNYPQDVDGTNPLANRDPHTAYIGRITDAYIIR